MTTFYVLWGNYYNIFFNTWTERMLGCYRNKANAEKMADNLRSTVNDTDVRYYVKEENFCD